MINVPEITRLQLGHHQYYLAKEWGLKNENTSPDKTLHPYMSSTLVFKTLQNHQHLHSMSEECGSFPGLEYQKEFSPAAHFGYSVYEQSLPVLIGLPHLFLYEEELPTPRNLGARREFWRSFENNCIDQALQEFSWKQGEKQRLMEHLEDLRFPLCDLDQLGCLEIDELFVAVHLEHDETAPRPLTMRSGAYNRDQNKGITARRQLAENRSYRAKSQLDLYNKQWKDIQVQVAEGATSPAKQAPLAIPWPKASVIRTSHFQLELDGITAAQETLWKWATHAFFVEAFGLRPVSNRHEKGETSFGLASHRRTETLAKLKALRRQMKVEKVRWHEDKMRAAFGLAAATHEKVKAVWGAVINLGDIVERELNSLST